MKKIITLLLILSLVLSLSVTGFAWAVREPRGEKVESSKTKDDIFFEDFSTYEEGGLPNTMSINVAEPSTAEIAEYETLSGKKNVLKIIDNQDVSGGVTTTLTVPEHTEPLTFEIRMKHKKTITAGWGFVMDFKDAQGNNAFRLIRFSADNDSYCFVNSGGNKPITKGANHDDVWYTVKLRMDPQKKQVGIIIESDELRTATLAVAKYANVLPLQDEGKVLAYSLPWFNEFSSDRVSKITMTTYSNTAGEYYIDYAKFTNNVPEEDFLPVRTRAESKETNVVADPSIRLIPNIVNLKYKGEIKYLANQIILNNGRSMMDAEEFAALYGMELSKEENAYKLSGEVGEIIFELDAYNFKSKGNTVTTDTTPMKENNIIYIPIKSFASSLGSTISWQDDPQCVIIE